MTDPNVAQAISQVLPTVQGWCTLDKGRHLGQLVLDNRPRLAVEIGVYAGKSLVALALAARAVGGFVVGIDAWSREANCDGWGDDNENQLWWAQVDMEPFYLQAQSTIAIWGLRHHCAVLRARAEDAATVFAEQSIDLLHIDGNHSEATSCRDVEMYLPRLRQGGILIFDDTNWSSTTRATKQIGAACDLMENKDSYAVYRKRINDATDHSLCDRPA